MTHRRTTTRRAWLAVVDEEGLRRVARNEWRDLALVTRERRPVAGDRVDVLVTRGPSFVAAARLAGSAEVVDARGESLRIRHRFVAPNGHEPALGAAKPLGVVVGWTHQRLGVLVGGLVPLTSDDHERIEDALRRAALDFGPEPKRPRHRRPRTPGRRALGEGRAAVRGVGRPGVR